MVGFVSCSKDDSEGEGNIVGYWKQTIEVYEVVSASTSKVLYTEPLDETYFEYKFESDGTFQLWYQGTQRNGTYNIANDKLYLFLDNLNLTYYLTFTSSSEMTLTSERNSERVDSNYGEQVIYRWVYRYKKEF